MMTTQDKEIKQPFLILLLLILAGEAVFILPFVLARIFRPTFLEVFQITNFQLGTCFSIYGIIAMLSYIGGGIIADKYNAGKLISIALILTSFGGFYMYTIPDYHSMKFLFGYWGFTTIFLFWGAMIKATRIWGGSNRQGKAFGFLDGGRGMVAAGFGTIALIIFSLFIGTELETVDHLGPTKAFKSVILTTSILVALIGVLTFFLLKFKNTDVHLQQKLSNRISLTQFIKVIKLKSVWLLMLIVLCAYVGYKITDVFSLYAKEVMNYTDLNSAKVGTFLLYLRPIVGVAIGLLADRSKTSLWMLIGFLIMFIGALIFSSGIIDQNMTFLFFLSIVITATGIYSIRTLYFAVLQEGLIPVAMTGTAVGLISFIGYTPDIFVGPITGLLLDNNPGELGHQYVFVMLGIFAFLGLLLSYLFIKNTNSLSTK